MKAVPTSFSFHGFQPPLTVLQTTNLQVLYTEAAVDSEVREMSRSLSLPHFLTWHFRISNLNSIICSLLSEQGDCIDTGHLYTGRCKNEKCSAATVENSSRELCFRYYSKICLLIRILLEFLLPHRSSLQFCLSTLQLHF